MEFEKKSKTSLSSNPFFYIRSKKYFNCYEYYEKSRKFLVKNSKFYWFWELEKYFYYIKKIYTPQTIF